MSPPHRPRVLIADDHLMVAEALKSLLTPEFELVGVVEDGRALIEAAATLRPDVIVADVTMPHLNGIEALAQLRHAGDRVPVVFLTMHRDVTFARRALDAPASSSSTRRLPSWSQRSAQRSRARPTSRRSSRGRSWRL
jgi:DNA-binding NarL/FixJ family response regulator